LRAALRVSFTESIDSNVGSARDETLRARVRDAEHSRVRAFELVRASAR
jgi:hypothetical protein